MEIQLTTIITRPDSSHFSPKVVYNDSLKKVEMFDPKDGKLIGYATFCDDGRSPPSLRIDRQYNTTKVTTHDMQNGPVNKERDYRKVGTALSEAAFLLSFALGYEGRLSVDAAYGSTLFHYHFGFRVKKNTRIVQFGHSFSDLLRDVSKDFEHADKDLLTFSLLAKLMYNEEAYNALNKFEEAERYLPVSDTELLMRLKDLNIDEDSANHVIKKFRATNELSYALFVEITQNLNKNNNYEVLEQLVKAKSQKESVSIDDVLSDAIQCDCTYVENFDINAEIEKSINNAEGGRINYTVYGGLMELPESIIQQKKKTYDITDTVIETLKKEVRNIQSQSSSETNSSKAKETVPEEDTGNLPIPDERGGEAETQTQQKAPPKEPHQEETITTHKQKPVVGNSKPPSANGTEKKLTEVCLQRQRGGQTHLLPVKMLTIS